MCSVFESLDPSIHKGKVYIHIHICECTLRMHVLYRVFKKLINMIGPLE
jgi:hypothetical protein